MKLFQKFIKKEKNKREIPNQGISKSCDKLNQKLLEINNLQ